MASCGFSRTSLTTREFPSDTRVKAFKERTTTITEFQLPSFCSFPRPQRVFTFFRAALSTRLQQNSSFCLIFPFSLSFSPFSFFLSLFSSLFSLFFSPFLYQSMRSMINMRSVISMRSMISMRYIISMRSKISTYDIHDIYEIHNIYEIKDIYIRDP